MPLRYDTSPPLSMDQGLRFDAGPVTPTNLRTRSMNAKLKLELKEKNTVEEDKLRGKRYYNTIK